MHDGSSRHQIRSHDSRNRHQIRVHDGNNRHRIRMHDGNNLNLYPGYMTAPLIQSLPRIPPGRVMSCRLCVARCILGVSLAMFWSSGAIWRGLGGYLGAFGSHLGPSCAILGPSAVNLKYQTLSSQLDHLLSPRVSTQSLGFPSKTLRCLLPLQGQ